MDRVWGYTSALDTGTVTVHIRRLREKVEDVAFAPAAPRDRVGRRLPVHAVTAFALITIPASLAASALVAVGVRRLPTVKLQLAVLALYAAAVPLATVTAAGLVMMKMHEDLAVLYIAARAERLRSSSRSCSADPSPAASTGWSSTAGELASGDLTARAPQDGPAELARARPVAERDGRLARGGFRRAQRARRLGEPRPAHTGGGDPRDARGDRGRSRCRRRVPARAPRADDRARRGDRRPLRAGAHRRRRPLPRARAAVGR